MASMDAWLGAETGLLKGVSVSRKQAVNFSSSSRLNRGQEVRVLAWAGPGEVELLVGSEDGVVRTFNADKGTFTSSRRCGEPHEGCFSGLLVLGSHLATCTHTGAVRVWKEDCDEPVTELRAGEHVHRMRQSPAALQRVATGGKENPLKIWDLEKPDKPVFSAKNLRDTWLDLRQPHWVKDMAFIPGTERVVTCTGYHQVHIYDPSTPQRRPVFEALFGDFPLTALSLPADGHTVAVANTQGQMALLDLRKGLVHGVLKGATGSIRALQCHETLPLIASCGLDRHLRIHSLQDRKLQHKVYLKSRLNCLLFSSNDPNAEAKPVKVKEEEEEEDEVWDQMESVHEVDMRVHEEEEEETTVHKEEEEETCVHKDEEEESGVHEEEETSVGDKEEEERDVHEEETSVNKDEEEEKDVHERETSVHKEEEEEKKVSTRKVKTKRKTESNKAQKKSKKHKKGQD